MKTIEKLDLQRTDPQYYKASKEPGAIDLTARHYLSVAGQGDPDGAAFAGAMKALYGAAYGIKFFKKQEGRDFKIPKMEGFWWSELGKNLQKVPRDAWRWKLLIPMPGFVTAADLDRVRSGKKDLEMAAWYTEPGGLFVQILHVGPYEEEEESIDKLLWWVKHKGYQIAGEHKEIYLTDPRRTPGERLKTILRYRIN